MSTELAERPATALEPQPIDEDVMRKLLRDRDLSKLTSDQQWQYYLWVCHSVGLDPSRFPFDFIQDEKSKKTTLYANKECANQLRDMRRVNIIDIDQQQVGSLFVVTVKAQLPDGRTDADIGAVSTMGQKQDGSTWQMSGDRLANALKKAVTQGKRRVTLSICGLGFLDETETDTIPGAVTMSAASVLSETKSDVVEEAPAAGPPPEPQPAPSSQSAASDFDALTDMAEKIASNHGTVAKAIFGLAYGELRITGKVAGQLAALSPEQRSKLHDWLENRMKEASGGVPADVAESDGKKSTVTQHATIRKLAADLGKAIPDDDTFEVMPYEEAVALIVQYGKEKKERG